MPQLTVQVPRFVLANVTLCSRVLKPQRVTRRRRSLIRSVSLKIGASTIVSETAALTAVDLNCSVVPPCRELDFRGVVVKISETGDDAKVRCGRVEGAVTLVCN